MMMFPSLSVKPIIVLLGFWTIATGATGGGSNHPRATSISRTTTSLQPLLQANRNHHHDNNNNNNMMIKKMLSVGRGGGTNGFAIVPKATTIAKAMAYIIGAQSLFEFFAPVQATAAFGIERDVHPPLDIFLVKRAGACNFAFVIMLWQLVVEKASLAKAVGLSAIPGTIELVHTLLNGQMASLGFSLPQQYLLLVLWALMAYSGITGKFSSMTLVKVYAIVQFILGLPLFFVTERCLLQLFGYRHPEHITPVTKVHAKALALTTMSSGILASFILWGNVNTTTKAVGYALIPMTLYIFSGTFITKEFTNMGLSQGVVISWLVFFLIIVAALTLSQ